MAESGLCPKLSLNSNDLKRIKIEGFASGLSEKEISLDLVKKVERIINKEK